MIVARSGRSHAAVEIALCTDGRYRMAVSLWHSCGGFSGPIVADAPGYPAASDARTAGLEELLRRWPTPRASDPHSLAEGLADMREQIVGQLRQPTLL
ncbi:MAG: hypothetical protein ACKVS8_11030 [Phycisphaerales bacterium]